jgi:hypothetical protein
MGTRKTAPAPDRRRSLPAFGWNNPGKEMADG